MLNSVIYSTVLYLEINKTIFNAVEIVNRESSLGVGTDQSAAALTPPDFSSPEPLHC